MLSSRFPQIVQLPKVKICSSVTICLAIHISDEKLWLRQEKTGDGNDHEENYFFRVTEAIFVGWFTLEYLIRFIVSPYKVWIQREGIVDLFSIAPAGHNIWWENRWNGSFGPKNDPTLFFFVSSNSKLFLWGGGQPSASECNDPPYCWAGEPDWALIRCELTFDKEYNENISVLLVWTWLSSSSQISQTSHERGFRRGQPLNASFSKK